MKDKLKKISKYALIGTAVFVAIFIIAGIDASNDGVEQNETTSQTEAVSDQDTFSTKLDFGMRTEDAVESLLKAPATAQFQENYSEITVEDGIYTYNSYVDSENSFGANIRSDFSSTGVLNDGEWSLLSLTFDGEIVVDNTSSTTATSS